MALVLSWDNTVLLANANVLAVRAYWRLKTVGGAFNTTGFSPANDMNKSIVTTSFTVSSSNVNKVFEFKISSICSEGGPTDNGLVEGIVFSCIVPSLVSYTNRVDVDINFTGTDITKVRYTLKKQSDNSIVGGPIIVNVVANNAPHSFTGLIANTGYYLEVELYATVNGTEVISSAANYLNAVCGGNTSGYQISTLSDEILGNINNNSNCCGCEDDNGRILGITFNGNSINMVTGSLPMLVGGSGTGTFPPGTHDLVVIVDGISPEKITVIDSMGNLQCQPYSGADSYTFPGFIVNSTNIWSIQFECGACPP